MSEYNNQLVSVEEARQQVEELANIIKVVWQIFICVFNMLGQLGFFMMAFGFQRRNKHSATIMMRQLISLCFVFVAFECIGTNIISNRLNGILGGSGDIISQQTEINSHKVCLLLECCFGNTIALMQLSECSTFETDILFSVIFGAIIYPVGISWTVGDGWLNSLGFIDPAHCASQFLLGAVCGFVGNLMVGLKFENRKSIFIQTLQKKQIKDKKLDDSFPQMLQNLRKLKQLEINRSNALNSTSQMASISMETILSKQVKAQQQNVIKTSIPDLSAAQVSQKKRVNSFDETNNTKPLQNQKSPTNKRLISSDSNSSQDESDNEGKIKSKQQLLDTDLVLNETIKTSDHEEELKQPHEPNQNQEEQQKKSQPLSEIATKMAPSDSLPNLSSNPIMRLEKLTEPSSILEQQIQEAISEVRQNLSPEYNNSGLKDSEIVKVLELIQKHLTEVTEAQNYSASMYYTTGGYFLYLALLMKSVTNVLVPEANWIQLNNLQKITDLAVQQQAQASNSPGTILTGGLLSSSVSLAVYLICETIFTLTIGANSQYRSYHMMNALLSGLVFATGLSSLTTEPLICVILGAIAGIFYCLCQRVYGRYKVLNGEMSIIFGVMTIGEAFCVAIFSKKNGLISSNTQSQIQFQVLGITVLTSWGVMWSWIFFYILKKIKRLKYGEIFEIVGLDNLALNNTDYFLKVGLSKDVIERIEQKQRIGQKISNSELVRQRKRSLNNTSILKNTTS